MELKQQGGNDIPVATVAGNNTIVYSNYGYQGQPVLVTDYNFPHYTTVVIPRNTVPPPPENPPVVEEGYNLLNEVIDVEFRQMGALREGLSCGLWPNSYLVSDNQRLFQPTDAKGQPHGEAIPLPIFFVQQDLGACCSSDWCGQACCRPRNTTKLKFYKASAPFWHDRCCGLLPSKLKALPVRSEGAFLTIQRKGIFPGCLKCVGGFVCMECCADEQTLHKGDISTNVSIPTEDTEIGRGVVPIGGGGLTPTIQVMQRDGSTNEDRHVGYVEGPTFFGGASDICCDNQWFISREKGKKGDIGLITKRAPTDCASLCVAVCTDNDVYDMKLHNEYAKDLSAESKALLVSEMVQLDYLFYEQDQGCCYVEDHPNSVYVQFTMCNMYCYGALCPCALCAAIPKKK